MSGPRGHVQRHIVIWLSAQRDPVPVDQVVRGVQFVYRVRERTVPKDTYLRRVLARLAERGVVRIDGEQVTLLGDPRPQRSEST